MFAVLAEAAAHGGVLAHLTEQAVEAYKELIGGFAGGFVGFFVHNVHHKLWRILLPHHRRHA